MGQLPSSGDPPPSILCILCSNLDMASSYLGLPKGSCENLSHIKPPGCVKPYKAAISLRPRPKAIAGLHLQDLPTLIPLTAPSPHQAMLIFWLVCPHTPRLLLCRAFPAAVPSGWNALPCKQSRSLFHSVLVSTEIPLPQNGFS